MTSHTYIFLPDVPLVTEQGTKQEIAQQLAQKYPQVHFSPEQIVVAHKDNRYNAYAPVEEKHESGLLAVKEITVGKRNIPLKKCFPHHQIYIRRIPEAAHFGQFGKIRDVELFTADSANEKYKDKMNHCYIRYEKDEDAEKCLFCCKLHTIGKAEDIRVSRAYKVGQSDETDKKIFLKLQPVVKADQVSKLETQLNDIFGKYGQLRERVRIEQLNNISSKALITYTSTDAGQKALEEFSYKNLDNHALTLRPYASKENYMVFVGGLRKDVSAETLKDVLSKYGKILNCSINPSKSVGINNAVVSFAEEESFKVLLADYRTDQSLSPLFQGKPYIDMHMSATLRNDWKHHIKKEKKNQESGSMNRGGIGAGYQRPFGFPNQPMMPMMGPNSQMRGPPQNGMGGFNMPNMPNMPNNPSFPPSRY